MSTSSPAIEPGRNPGALWVRVLVDGRLLVDHAIGLDGAEVDGAADALATIAAGGRAVALLVFDGDSGALVARYDAELGPPDEHERRAQRWAEAEAEAMLREIELGQGRA
jgi:hypothetical protein